MDKLVTLSQVLYNNAFRAQYNNDLESLVQKGIWLAFSIGLFFIIRIIPNSLMYAANFIAQNKIVDSVTDKTLNSLYGNSNVDSENTNRPVCMLVQCASCVTTAVYIIELSYIVFLDNSLAASIFAVSVIDIITRFIVYLKYVKSVLHS